MEKLPGLQWENLDRVQPFFGSQSPPRGPISLGLRPLVGHPHAERLSGGLVHRFERLTGLKHFGVAAASPSSAVTDYRAIKLP